jgi:hypothetical protein
MPPGSGFHTMEAEKDDPRLKVTVLQLIGSDYAPIGRGGQRSKETTSAELVMVWKDPVTPFSAE